MTSPIPDYVNKINSLLPGAEIVIRSKPLSESEANVYIEGLKKLFPGLSDADIMAEKIADKRVVTVKELTIQRLSSPKTTIEPSSIAQQVKQGERKEQKSEASRVIQAPRKTLGGVAIPEGFVYIEGAPTGPIDESKFIRIEDLPLGEADKKAKVAKWLPLFREKGINSHTQQILLAHAYPQNILKMGNVDQDSFVTAIHAHKDHPDKYVFEIRRGTFVFRIPGVDTGRGPTFILLSEKEIDSFIKSRIEEA